jgi:hypothetical protein
MEEKFGPKLQPMEEKFGPKLQPMEEKIWLKQTTEPEYVRLIIVVCLAKIHSTYVFRFGGLFWSNLF